MQFINQVSDMRGDTGKGEKKSGTRCADQRGSGREVTRIQKRKAKKEQNDTGGAGRRRKVTERGENKKLKN